MRRPAATTTCCSSLDSYGAAADVRRGNLSAGFTLACQALELAERRGWAGLPQTAMAHVSLAVTHLWWHELDNAELSADRAEAALAGSGDRLLPTTVALVRARLMLMRGESLPALEGLRAAFEAAPRPIPDFLSVSGGPRGGRAPARAGRARAGVVGAR